MGLEFEGIHVVIGTPAYGGQVYDKYMVSYQRSVEALRQLGAEVSRISLGSESLIPRGRNRLVHTFLCMGATHYLQVDADIEWDPHAIIGMLRAKKRVIACAYPIKQVNYADIAAAALRGESHPERYATKLAINPLLEVEQPFDNGAVRVRDAATGFLMVERDVFIEMMEKHPELYYFSDVGPGSTEYGLPLFTLFDCQIINERLWDKGPLIPRYLSEDYLFCRRWQDMGGEIWLFLGANLNHIGSHTYRGDVTAQFTFSPGPAVDQTEGAKIVEAK